MSTVRRRLVTMLVAVFATLAGLLAATVPAAADPVPAPVGVGASVSAYGDLYGAIALAMSGGAVGWSYDYGTKGAAFRRALNACRAHSDYPWSCEKIVWVLNGCAAVAVSWSGNDIYSYGWGIARSKRVAYWRALDKCGPDCVKRAYTCTAR